MGLRFLYWLIRTVNWRALLVSSGERVPFGEILGARIAGYAVSYLTPAGNIGGETVRIFCLDSVDRNKALATVVVDKTIEFLAGLSTIALAVVFLITEFALPRRQKIELFAAIAALMLVLIFLILKQKQGLFTWALDTLKKIKIRIPFFENRRDKILETDAHISDFYSRNTAALPGPLRVLFRPGLALGRRDLPDLPLPRRRAPDLLQVLPDRHPGVVLFVPAGAGLGRRLRADLRLALRPAPDRDVRGHGRHPDPAVRRA